MVARGVFLGPGLVVRTFVVPAQQALLVKGLVEAHEGVASVFGERGGPLVLAAPADREAELDDICGSVAELLASVSAPSAT